MASLPERLRRAVLLAGLSPLLAVANPPPSFQASFELLRNGKPQGTAELTYTTEALDWRLNNSSKGTRGGARLLGFSEQTGSTGEWREGLPRPLHFQQNVRAALRDRNWEAEFDWTAAVVTLRNGDEESSREVTTDTLDPLSAGLRIRVGLGIGEDHWRFPMVDRDELDANEFRAGDEETIDTALGCLVTRRVEKVRAPESTRYTRTWYARDLGWAPVRGEHGKTGGNQIESRIVSLSVDGHAVTPRPACADSPG